MKEQKKRIFIAIDLPPKIKGNMENKYLSALAENFPKDALKLTKPENLHITLIFLGGLLSEIIKKVEQIIKKNLILIKSFNLEIGDFGVFLNERNPRILWVSAYDQLKLLNNLTQDLARDLSKININCQQNDNFVSHITLGRTRRKLGKMDREKLKNLKKKMENQKKSIFRVNSIDIMESRLSSEGLEYVVIGRFKLK